MTDRLTEAVKRAAEFGAPPKLWQVGPDAAVALGVDTGEPFDGITITHWTHD
ncbi:hypothetical protein [Mycolicibacterium vaccae]|uniref:hypothetical protein n=1 Tax=Mycolicibacterium vaccae TaxID=1810 RepID=UPI003D016FDB